MPDDSGGTTRQQRLDELARDWEGLGGKTTPDTRREALIALTLEDQGVVPGPVERPRGRHGDFVDGDDREWDIKMPMSRGHLRAKILHDAREAGKPAPVIPPGRR